MAPDHAKPPGNDGDSSNTAGIGAIPEKIIMWIIKDGPRAARIPVLLAIVVGVLAWAASQAHTSLQQWAPAKTDDALVKQLELTASAQSLLDSAEVERALQTTTLTQEQREAATQHLHKMAHQLRHLTSPKNEDKSPWTIFAKQSSDTYFGYKFFASDKCLLIARVEKGAGVAEWLTDPLHQDIPLPDKEKTAKPSKAPAPAATDSLLPIAFIIRDAIGTSSDHSEVPPDMKTVAMQGNCINPHPWNFNGWWGSPINQCQQPFFRTWADGCSHVQIYDRCGNIWGPIVWQACAGYHHP